MLLQDPGLPGDVEMDLGQSFPINPQIKGALKSLDGVLDVEEV
jgi:DNA polymerase-3 subunit alpha